VSVDIAITMCALPGQYCKRATKQLFTSAAEITEAVVHRRLPREAPCPALLSLKNIARAANKRRHRHRQCHPKMLDFNVQYEHLPEHFICGDIHVGSRCHTVLATDTQLELLSKAKTWYVNGTFKVSLHLVGIILLHHYLVL